MRSDEAGATNQKKSHVVIRRAGWPIHQLANFTYNTHMTDKADQLRALHKAPPILVLPNVWDCVSARLVQAEGFPAIATTSAGMANSLGYPDGGAVPPSEMLPAIARITRAVSVPVSADVEHGYATTPDALADMVLRVIAAGAVGVNLEDHVPGAAELEPLGVQCDKLRTVIKAAAKAGVRVVINARTDVFLKQMGAPESRLGIAIERGNAFLEAGADCVFVPGVRGRDTIAALATGIKGPLNILAVPGSPTIPELETLGVARVSVGSAPHRATAALMRAVAQEMKSAGTYSFADNALPYDIVNNLMR
jgi:2-methylisocitrate lyase-like PEP mutase family enzyme